MKKLTTAAIAALLILSTLLCACGDKKDDNKSDKTASKTSYCASSEISKMNF